MLCEVMSEADHTKFGVDGEVESPSLCVGMVHIYTDKTAKVLNSSAIVAHHVHVVLSNLMEYFSKV